MTGGSVVQSDGLWEGTVLVSGCFGVSVLQRLPEGRSWNRFRPGGGVLAVMFPDLILTPDMCKSRTDVRFYFSFMSNFYEVKHTGSILPSI